MTPTERAKRLMQATSKKRRAAEMLEEFREKFLVNPVYSFQWADKDVQAAVEFEVYSQIVHYLETDVEWEAIVREFRRELSNRGSRLYNSTSAMSNYVDVCKVMVMTRLFDNWDGVLSE